MSYYISFILNDLKVLVLFNKNNIDKYLLYPWGGWRGD